MATTAFKNFSALASTTMTDVYTCPAATTALVSLLQISNINATLLADVTVVFSDASASNAEYEIVKNLTMPIQTAVSITDGSLVLEAGDKIRIQASAGSIARLIGSVSELS